MTSIIKYIWKNKAIFQLLLIVALIIFLMQECRHNKYNKEKNEQNFHALTEKITTIELKNGELISEKAIFVGSLDELKEANAELYKIAEEIKKNGSKPQIITLTKIVFVDSGKVENKLLKFPNNNYSLKFDYNDSDSIIHIDGDTYFNAKPFLKNDGTLDVDIRSNYTKFNSIKFKTGLVVGIKKDKDGIDRVYAKSEPFSNKITFENIDAVELENFYKEKYKNNKVKRFGIGPTIGYGIVVDSKSGIVKTNPYLGIGINYSLIRF